MLYCIPNHIKIIKTKSNEIFIQQRNSEYSAVLSINENPIYYKGNKETIEAVDSLSGLRDFINRNRYDLDELTREFLPLNIEITQCVLDKIKQERDEKRNPWKVELQKIGVRL